MNSTGNPTAAATQLKDAGVDVVYHSGLSGTCAALNTAMDRIGFKPELVMLPSSCALSAEFIAAGNAAEGATLPLYMKEPNQPGLESDEGVKQYLTDMEGVDEAVQNDPVATAGWVQADLMIATVDKYAPGFAASVVGRQALSPLDLEREFGLLGGDIFHGALTLNQLFSARPMLGHADYRGPLKGLYHCGSGAHPGGGVTGAPGHNAAQVILRDHRALFGSR